MAVLTGYLPVEQGIACYAALRRHADTAVATGDGALGIRSWPTPILEPLAHRALNPPPSSSLTEGRTPPLAPPPCGGARFPTLAAPVERITGQTRATDVNVELQLLMPLDSLLNKENASVAVIPGYCPLPGKLARQILTTSQGRKWWRRLFTAPSLSANN
jgi:hypothetical protein